MATRRQQVIDMLASWTDRQLHAVAFRLNHQRTSEDLSEHQEWFWGLLIKELELRRATARWPHPRCSCELCWSPFPD